MEVAARGARRKGMSALCHALDSSLSCILMVAGIGSQTAAVEDVCCRGGTTYVDVIGEICVRGLTATCVWGNSNVHGPLGGMVAWVGWSRLVRRRGWDGRACGWDGCVGEMVAGIF